MYKYKGTDPKQYILGVPARNLSDEEFEALPKDVQDACLKSNLYVKATDKLVDPVKQKE